MKFSFPYSFYNDSVLWKFERDVNGDDFLLST
jgi:hypothetical protein